MAKRSPSGFGWILNCPWAKQDCARYVRKEKKQMLKLAHKDFRTAIINIFKNLKRKDGQSKWADRNSQ